MLKENGNGESLSRVLLSEIKEDEMPKHSWGQMLRQLAPDAMALLLGPAVAVPFASCYAALICRIPALRPHFPEVLQQVMWTQFAGAVLSLFLGQFVTTNNMDPLVAILLGQLAHRVKKEFEKNPAGSEAFYQNLVLVIPLVTAALGLVLFAVGRFRLAFMLRFFPYPVVGGFLAGSGILILQEALALAAGGEITQLVYFSVVRPMHGHDNHTTAGDYDYFGDDGEVISFTALASAWLQMLLAIAYSELMAFARKAHTFGTPIILVICVLACVIVNFLSQGALPPQSWFLAFPGPVQWWAPFNAMARGVQDFHTKTFLDHFDLIASFISIMTVSWSINVLAIAKLVPLKRGRTRCEEQEEIRDLGISNVILGLLGGHASMQSFKIPMMMREVEAGYRWPLFNLVACFFFLLYSPRLVVINVPRFIFAGNVVRLSSDLINDWLIEAKSRIAFNEWCVLVVSALVTVWNVNVGVIFGLFLTLLLFAVEYSGITGVTKTGSLKDVRSMVERSHADHEILVQYGESVRIVWLSGYLFFGSATLVADEVRRCAEDKHVLLVVLDFTLVPAMDASGVYALVDLVEELQSFEHQPGLVFCGLVRRLANALRNAAQDKEISATIKHDLDSALEWCEGELFQFLDRKGLVKHRTGSSLPRIDSLGQVPGIAGDDETTFEEIWEQLLAAELNHLDPQHTTVAVVKAIVHLREVDAGTTIFASGEKAHELVVLVSGSLEVIQPAPTDQPEVHLPRHHLNEKKGDVFVFEEARPRRVRKARRGAVFGAVEYAASSFRDAAGQNGDSLTGHTCARQHSTTCIAVGTVEVLVLPFEELNRAESEHPRFALVLRTWLSRLASDALLSTQAGVGVAARRAGPPLGPGLSTSAMVSVASRERAQSKSSATDGLSKEGPATMKRQFSPSW